MLQVGNQRTGGDAGHAELRDRPEAETQRTAKDDLADGGNQHQQRWQFHVAGAAQDAGHGVHQPWHDRATEEYLGVADRLRQHVAAAAEQFQQFRAKDQHAQHKDEPEAQPDQQGMGGQRRGAIDIAGAKRAGNGGCDPAAHGAARHRHGQHHAGKHQRHRGQRFDAEPADVGGLGYHHTGAGRQCNDVGPGEPQQRPQDRTVDQRVLRRRQRGRQRAFFLIDGNFGNADIGHFCSRARGAIPGIARQFNILGAIRVAPGCFLARQGLIPRARHAMGACAWVVVEFRAISVAAVAPLSHDSAGRALGSGSCFGPHRVRITLAQDSTPSTTMDAAASTKKFAAVAS